MNELSLHILDICENSVKANATLITLNIIEDIEKNILEISISDNGTGMDAKTLETVSDPFYTTRTTRNVGLGISLFKLAAELTGGSQTITSTLGIGTTVKTTFKLDHIDRAPLGDIGDTIIATLTRGNIELIYNHHFNNNSYEFSSIAVKEVLDGIPITESSIIFWIRNNIKDGLNDLHKKSK
jgi:hypothetical protein